MQRSTDRCRKNNMMMKKIIYPAVGFLLLSFISSCSAIGGIFKSGATAGIIAAVIIIAVLIWIIWLFRRTNRS